MNAELSPGAVRCPHSSVILSFSSSLASTCETQVLAGGQQEEGHTMRSEREGGGGRDEGKHLRHGALISACARPSGDDGASTSLAVTSRRRLKQEMRLNTAHFQSGLKCLRTQRT